MSFTNIFLVSLVLALAGCRQETDKVEAAPPNPASPEVAQAKAVEKPAERGSSSPSMPGMEGMKPADGTHSPSMPGMGGMKPIDGTDSSPSGTKTEGPSSHAGHTAADVGPNPQGYATVSIDPSRQQLLGLRTSELQKRSFSRVLRTVGLVTSDETRTAHVHVKFSGWVEDVFIDFVGKPVKKGQPLMSIYSPELWTAQNEYLLAFNGIGATAETDPLMAVNARANHEMLDAARRRLKFWDIADAEFALLEKTRTPRRSLTLTAPISGTVVVRNVLPGMYVDPGTHLYVIADLSRIWVRAQIYEPEMPYVNVGQAATLEVEALPGRVLEGTVKFIQPTLSESTRTNEIRLEFDNRAGLLKPNMFATVQLNLVMGEGLAVPDEAVIDTGIHKIVFVARDDHSFEPRNVKLGAKIDDYYQVLEGLEAGDRVVISAQFLLDSESRLRGSTGTGKPAHAGHGG